MPAALRVFLLALAIIDDLGAIVIIAAFYTAELSPIALLGAGAGVLLLGAINLLGVRRLAPYILIGVAIWVCVLKSGSTRRWRAWPWRSSCRAARRRASPLHRLEHTLYPWVTFAIMPIFAFANAGVSFAEVTARDLLAPLPVGIAAGLFLGKQAGVFAAELDRGQAGHLPPAGGRLLARALRRIACSPGSASP